MNDTDYEEDVKLDFFDTEGQDQTGQYAMISR